MKTPQVMRESPTPLLLLLLLTGVCIDAYRPVVIVHGLFQGPEPFQKLVKYITKVGHLNSTTIQREMLHFLLQYLYLTDAVTFRIANLH